MPKNNPLVGGGLRIKRTINDLNEITFGKGNPLWDNGIFTYYNTDDVTTIYACLIGPEDTPYEDGFYGFEINIPQEYPFKPPKVNFLTTDGNVRFNPNLYACGKVCLSILGTWSGPPWTSICTISSVLLSIQSLLQPIPIQNEPGWDTVQKDNIKSITYNSAINHENFRIAIIDMIKSPEKYKMTPFKNLMIQHFIRRYPHIKNNLLKNVELDNKEIKSHIYSCMRMTGKYKKMLQDVENMYNEFISNDYYNTMKNILQIDDETVEYSDIHKYSDEEVEYLNNSNSPSEVISTDEKNIEYENIEYEIKDSVDLKKIRPSKKASSLEEGTLCILTASDKTFKFETYKDKSNRFRWRKLIN